MTGRPTLSQLVAPDFGYLGAFADRCERFSDLAEQVFEELDRDVSAPGGVEWRGPAGGSAIDESAADQVIVRGFAGSRREAAQVARRSQARLEGSHSEAMAAVDDAQRDGFAVGEDYSVTDTRQSSTREQQAARRAQARAHADYIGHKVGHLVDTDRTVGAQVRTAAAGWGTLAFPGTPAPAGGKHHGAHLVDWKGGLKDAPPQPDNPMQPDGGAGGYGSAPQQVPPPSTPAPVSAGPTIGQCTTDYVKKNLGAEMVKDGFKSGLEKAAIGAAGGAMLTPEAGGVGALPGAVLGFVGGFGQGLIEAPLKLAAKGALECADIPMPGLPKP
ncbi:MAG TPA: hypothetical protein VFR17_02385 [Mycobacterium sp.]|nr:hypothetical protein [Mycobacterium sp.]